MKSIKMPLLLAALCAFLFAGCASETPQQATATAIYASGYAASSDVLSKNPLQVATLQDVAAKLPLINSGKLTPTDMGVLSGELQLLGGDVQALRNLIPADSSKLDRAAAFISGVIQSNAALNGGRAPTADQVVATTALTDFANGLLDGIGYWQGRQSVKVSAVKRRNTDAYSSMFPYENPR